MIDRTSFLAGFAILLLGIALVLVAPAPVPEARDLVFDSYSRAMPRAAPGQPVIVVDVDDASLDRIGQWPWPRDRVAAIIDRLDAAGARAIGFDVLFSEPDRASPRRTLAPYAVTDPKIAALLDDLPDTDGLLAAAIGRSRVVLGVAFSSGDGPTEEPRRIADFRVGDQDEAKVAALAPRTGPVVVRPIAMLEAVASGIASINLSPSIDKVVRSVPLVVAHGSRLIPSLSIETLRVGRHKQAVAIDLDPSGRSIASLRIAGLPRPIETDPNGGLRLHWREWDRGRYVPAWQLLAGDVPRERIADAIVLVGTSAKGLQDQAFSPIGLIPGVEAHAQAIDQMLSGDWLVRPFWAPLAEATYLLLSGLVLMILVPRLGIAFVAAIALALVALIWGLSWTAFSTRGLLLDPIVPSVALASLYIVRTLGRHLASERERRWIRNAFSSYVSPNLVRHLIDNHDGLQLGGERRECSFVMTDLAGFTTLVEREGPEQVVRVLNLYIEGMVAVAFRNGGTIDRIVGDGIAVLFSAPVIQPDHRARALACALEMDAFSEEFGLARRAENMPVGITRIGVHSGPVIVGNVGGGTLMDYRALGDAINSAARMETANRHVGTRVMLSRAVLDGCPDASVRPIGTLVLKGKAGGIACFEPIAVDAPVLSRYREAFALMEAGHPGAAEAFARLADAFPDDGLVAFHARRLAQGDTGSTVHLAEK